MRIKWISIITAMTLLLPSCGLAPSIQSTQEEAAII